VGDLLGPFLARCRRSLGRSSELYLGTAGYLSAATLLYQKTGAPDALRVASELAADLLPRIRRASRNNPRLDFAHGQAGTLWALMAWAGTVNEVLPPWFDDVLARHAEAVERSGTMGTPNTPNKTNPEMRRSWCNGAGGQAMLWARAYQHTGDAACL